jgi:hypothetical protein
MGWKRWQRPHRAPVAAHNDTGSNCSRLIVPRTLSGRYYALFVFLFSLFLSDKERGMGKVSNEDEGGGKGKVMKETKCIKWKTMRDKRPKNA